jgi:D-sedoheptulose 7-phosphate isomerase
MLLNSISALETSLKLLSESPELNDAFIKASEALIKALKAGNKIMVAGNGGSAAEAQHFVAEIVGRYKTNRRGYPAITLSADTSIITAVANDFGYDTIFSRQIEALGKKGDVLVTLSTSGNSTNILKAIEEAKNAGIFTISLSGKDGGKSNGMTDLQIIVPSDDTARIQELHLLIIHSWCDLIEQNIA